VLALQHQEIEPNLYLVVASGRLMIGTGAEKVEEVVRDLVGKGAKAILFDLSGVTHLDSTGIGRFISSLTLAMQSGARMAFAGATPTVRTAFHVTRLDTVFRFYEDKDTAVAALR